MESGATISTKEFIALSACCMMLTAVGIDVMLPAFKEVRQHLRLDARSPDTAFIVTAFFWGQLFQIVFGLLSDRLGRLAVLRCGFPLYILGGIVAAFSGELWIMCLGRFVAGMGASAVFMTIIASVRDKFEGDDMARIMSFIFTIFLFTPVVAPFLGLAILQLAGWKAVFLFPPAFAGIVFLWSLRLPETLPTVKRAKGNVFEHLKQLRRVITEKSFLRYTGITTFLFGGISAYVSNSTFIVNELYDQSKLFTWIFAGVGLVMAAGALSNAKLSARYGAKKTVRGLLIAYMAVAVTLLAFCIWLRPQPHIILFFTGIAILLGLNLAVEPNSSALAMKNMGSNAGVASAVYGTSFFFMGALIGTMIGSFLKWGVIAMAIGFVIIGAVVLRLSLTDDKTDY